MPLRSDAIVTTILLLLAAAMMIGVSMGLLPQSVALGQFQEQYGIPAEVRVDTIVVGSFLLISLAFSRPSAFGWKQLRFLVGSVILGFVLLRALSGVAPRGIVVPGSALLDLAPIMLLVFWQTKPGKTGAFLMPLAGWASAFLVDVSYIGQSALGLMLEPTRMVIGGGGPFADGVSFGFYAGIIALLITVTVLTITERMLHPPSDKPLSSPRESWSSVLRCRPSRSPP
jgi:hypothetical protein